MNLLIAKSATLASLAIGLAATLPLPASAQTMPPPPLESVVSLSSSATVEVPKDWMAVTFAVSRDGADAAMVQAGLKDALGAALAQARRVARPDGQVEVQTGSFSLQPRLDAKGTMTGWSGRAELQVQGRDMGAIAQLVGQVRAMSVAQLSYGLSREAREKVESDVAAQAIARFRAKAADYAKAFGYGSYVLREVNVQTDSAQPPVPRMFAMKAAAMDAGAALPVEAGNGSVTANVSGSVQMK